MSYYNNYYRRNPPAKQAKVVAPKRHARTRSSAGGKVDRIRTNRELMLSAHQESIRQLPLHNHLVTLVQHQIQETKPISEDFLILAWRTQSLIIFDTLHRTCKIGMNKPRSDPFWAWYNNYIKNSSILVEPNPKDQSERVHQALSRLATHLSRTAATVRNLFDRQSAMTSRHLYNLPHSQMIAIESVLSQKFNGIDYFDDLTPICAQWSPALMEEFVRNVSDMVLNQRDPYMLLRIALGTAPFDVVSEDTLAAVVSFLDPGTIARFARINKTFAIAHRANATVIDTHVIVPISNSEVKSFLVSWSARQQRKVCQYFVTARPSTYNAKRNAKRPYEQDLELSLEHLEGASTCEIRMDRNIQKMRENTFIRNVVLPSMKNTVTFRLSFAKADPDAADRSRRNDRLLTNPPSPYIVCPPRIRELMPYCSAAQRIQFRFRLYSIRLCRDDPYSDLDDTYSELELSLLPGMSFTVVMPPHLTHITWSFACTPQYTGFIEDLVGIMRSVSDEEIAVRLAQFQSVELRNLFGSPNRQMHDQVRRWFAGFGSLHRLHIDSLAYLRNAAFSALIPSTIRVLEVECVRRLEWANKSNDAAAAAGDAEGDDLPPRVQQHWLNRMMPYLEDLTVTYTRGAFVGNPMQILSQLMAEFPPITNLKQLTINICRFDLARENKKCFEWDPNEFLGMMGMDRDVKVVVKFLHVPFRAVVRGVYAQKPNHPFYPKNVKIFMEFVEWFFKGCDLTIVDDPTIRGDEYQWVDQDIR